MRDLVGEIEDWFSDHFIVCTEVGGDVLPTIPVAAALTLPERWERTLRQSG